MKILIGHSTLRAAVMGYADRKPTAEEMAEMKRQVKIAMECGAAELSSGLIYAPGCYADIDELAELASVVKEYGGFYATHMRSESVGVVEAVKEAIEIGRRAGVPVWISHHKVAGRPYWLSLIHILPGHCCTTVNMFNEIYLVDGDEVVAKWDITSRGKAQ